MSSLRLLAEILFTRPAYRTFLIFCSLMAAITGLGAAFAQKEFVDTLMGAPLLFQSVDLHPLAWLAVSFVFILLSLALSQTVSFLATKESLFMQRTLADRLYQRVLELQSSDMRGRSVGEIVAIYTTDVPGSTILIEQSMPQGFGIFFPLVLAPMALIHLFDLPILFVVGMLGTVVLINLVLAFQQSKYFFLFKKLAADRIGLVNEWVQNIRTLRVLGLTSAFEQKIIKVRKNETENRINMLTNGQTMNAISSSMTFLINVAVVALLVQRSPQQITPGGLLALLWIVGIFLTRPFRQLPWFFTFIFDGWTSLKRLSSALSMRSTPPQIQRASPSVAKAAKGKELFIQDLNLKIHGHQLLSDIRLEIGPGEFVAIVGEVGSGKSLLLQSLLGETPASFGAYIVQGEDASQKPMSDIRSHFAFVPQEGFTMSATLVENVLFDYDASAASNSNPELLGRIESVLHQAEFDPSTERISNGLFTEIGERGVNLSGGQKQRISIARAIYNEARILLLDDSFSAVDADTEKKLIRGLFEKAWKKRSRLLVTHRLTVLPQADRIYFMQKGRIVDSGTWDELRARSTDFVLFVQSIAANEAAEEAVNGAKNAGGLLV